MSCLQITMRSALLFIALALVSTCAADDVVLPLYKGYVATVLVWITLSLSVMMMAVRADPGWKSTEAAEPEIAHNHDNHHEMVMELLK